MNANIKDIKKRYIFFVVGGGKYSTIPFDSAASDPDKCDMLFRRKCIHFILRYRTLETNSYFIHLN